MGLGLGLCVCHTELLCIWFGGGVCGGWLGAGWGREEIKRISSKK
jgi:hypothetical protein